MVDMPHNVIVLLFLFSLSTYIFGHKDRMEVLRERLKRLEIRFVEDVSLLRSEFRSELENIEDRISDGHASVSKDTMVDSEMGSTSSKKLLEIQKTIMSQIQSMKRGLVQEKRQRRDLQANVDRLKSNERDIVDIFKDVENDLLPNLTAIAAKVDVREELHEILNVLKQMLHYESNKFDASSMHARSCYDLLRKGHVTSGVYTIYPDVLWRPLDVYCDMQTDGGGWIFLQRRCDGSENFYRPWMDYRFGFGNISGEFWLGNEFIHLLTSDGPQELRIELEDFENNTKYVEYSLFSVGSSDDLFRLSLGHFQGGTAPESFLSCRHHRNKQFSTFDKGPANGCSKQFKGGFWYGGCHCVNVNGMYLNGSHESYADGVNWNGFRGHHYSLKRTEMKIRPM